MLEKYLWAEALHEAAILQNAASQNIVCVTQEKCHLVILFITAL